MKQLFRSERVSDNLLVSIESRDAALWIRKFPTDSAARDALVRLLRLPWALVVSEAYDSKGFNALAASDSVRDPLTRKRGFVQLIDSDPSRIQLPERCLPIYLLGGKTSESASPFDNELRKLTMLESIRRASPREMVVLSDELDPVPAGLKQLWSSGFRSHLTIVAHAPNAEERLKDWIDQSEGVAAVLLINVPTDSVVDYISSRYETTYPEERHVIRIRDVQGTLARLDITEADDPERPLLESYSLVEERDLGTLSPQQLSEEDFSSFFADSTSSWKPYAAGLPWIRGAEVQQKLMNILRNLDSSGAEGNCISYIKSEPGAGGTTCARTLAFDCARQGYPVLLARQIPFIPDALPVANFLRRVQDAVERRSVIERALSESEPSHRESTRRYEAPWIIVFDTLHWQYRDSELVRFRNELTKSGRPVCLLVVTGPYLALEFLNSAIFKELSELNHAIGLDEARDLGNHLNQFLRTYGKQRERWQWDRFYEDHAVKYAEGIAAFWVALSFWIQGQYDLSETIQEWMYKCFKANAKEQVIKEALLRIAALSSEGLPLPDVLLPAASGQWPVSQLLSDARPKLAALGLVRISSDGGKYWALVHDILGRFLINGLFYDFHERVALGLGDAKDAQHLRFLILRGLSRERVLGEVAYRAIGEDFATSIFKIDPDHGHGSFLGIWKDVLAALDEMARSLRDTSRLFRHHCAVSRRRIAKLDEEFYGVTQVDRISLLNRAIDDIRYALEFIEYSPGAESNLNLYNSLANAYFDLADAEAMSGSSRERQAELRKLANEATRKAYAESPENSFVIETYVKNLLQASRHSERPFEQCIEALGILFSALASNEAAYRAAQLGSLADQALRILLKSTPETAERIEPRNAIDVLVQAWRALVEGRQASDMALSNLPETNRQRALERLAHPAGRGNVQVVRLSYDLLCLNRPSAFKEQLELVEQLYGSDYRLTPQLRMEYAILLFQSARPQEGEKVFKFLRQLWRESEHFVQVPERLRWLRSQDGKVQTVHATTGSEYDIRPAARVQEFGQSFVPFRPEEFGFRSPLPGRRFSGHVTFGHNGPFLRPLTVGPRDSAGS